MVNRHPGIMLIYWVSVYDDHGARLDRFYKSSKVDALAIARDIQANCLYPTAQCVIVSDEMRCESLGYFPITPPPRDIDPSVYE